MTRRSSRVLRFVLAGIATVLVALVIAPFVIDWNWMRSPVERFATRMLEREVTIAHLTVRPGLTTVVQLREVEVANTDWSNRQPMAQVREVEFSLRLWSLIVPPRVISQLRLTDAQVVLERQRDGRANWEFNHGERQGDQHSDTGLAFELEALRLDRGALQLYDAKLDVRATAQARTVDDPRYPTRIEFSGNWRGATFGGVADTASVLSLRNARQALPLRLDMKVDETTLHAEGEVTGLSDGGRIDVSLAIAGPSLASLYPTIHLALPASPPYRLTGRLTREGNRICYMQLAGTIGSSDIGGSGELVLGEPRPRLTAALTSHRLNLADLGPIIGVAAAASARRRGVRPDQASKGERDAHPPGREDRSAQARARAAATGRDPQAVRPDKLLPTVDLSGERLSVIDADVRLDVDTLVLPSRRLPVGDLQARIQLDDGRLRIDPLRFDFAGGQVLGSLQLDGQQQPSALRAALDLRRIRLDRLLAGLEARLDTIDQSGGRLGAQLRLTGRGDSVADLAASANGSVTLGMDGGRISHLALATASLNGGRLLQLLLGGDKPSAIRCMGVAMGLKNGVGNIDAFVLDTEDVRVDAAGQLNLKQERYDITLRPTPKRPNILSVRAPVRVRGTFRDADITIEKTAVARAGAAAALALVNPLAALLPLIETGPGEDSNCSEVLAPVKGAARQAQNRSEAAPAK